MLQVLRCLTEKQEEIEDTDCKNEVFQFEKMEVSDMRNDAPMALACKADLEKYCKGVKPGAGGVAWDVIITALASMCGAAAAPVQQRAMCMQGRDACSSACESTGRT